MTTRKIFLLALLFLAVCPVAVFAQGGQVFGFAIQNNNNFAELIPNASLELCQYNDQLLCSTTVGIYADPQLSAPLSNPTYADSNGVYNFFAAPGSYVLKTCSPTQYCYTYSLVIQGSGGGGGGGGAGLICVETYATADMNGDYGQIINAAIRAQSLLAPSNISLCTQGNHPISTTIVKDRPVTVDFTGSVLVPQSGGTNTAWGSSPITIGNAVLTSGSTAVVVSNSNGLSDGMAIGGVGVQSASQIATEGGTQITLTLPAKLTFNCLATTGSAVLTSCTSLQGVVVGQTIINSAAIPAATSITGINYSVQSITMSAAATASPAAPISVSISGSWTTNLTAQTVAPVASMVYNVQALRNAEGQNVGGTFTNLWIQDPGLTVTCTEAQGSPTLTNCSPVAGVLSNMSVTGTGIPFGTTTSGTSGTSVTITNAATSSGIVVLNMGFNLGRTLTGVQGLQIAGWDTVLLTGLKVYNLLGSGLILGGYNAVPNSHNGLVRESEIYYAGLRDDGSFGTGQPTIAIMSGSATGDEINQISCVGCQAVFNNGEAVTIGTYNLSHIGVFGLGPRLIWFDDNSQFEGGSHTGANLNSPVDMIGIQQAADVTIANSEINGAGYGKSGIRIDNAVTIAVTNSRMRGGAASAVTYQVMFTSGSPIVNYVSGGSGGFDTTGRWNGVGMRTVDLGTCSLTCNVYLADSNAVVSSTSLLLATNYQGSTGAGSLTYTPGSLYVNVTGSLNYLFSSGTTSNQASNAALASLQLTAAQTFYAGYTAATVFSDFAPTSLFFMQNFVNPKISGGTLLNITGNNIAVGSSGGVSWGDILGGLYNGTFCFWVKQALGSNTNSNYCGLDGSANFFSFDYQTMGWGAHVAPGADNWLVDQTGSTNQAGNAVIGGTLNVTGTVTLGSSINTTTGIDIETSRTSSGSFLTGTCASLTVGNNCGIMWKVDGGSLDFSFLNFVNAGPGSTNNRMYGQLNGGADFISWNGNTFGWGTHTDPTTDEFQVDGSGHITAVAAGLASLVVGAGSTVNAINYYVTASITPTSVTNATCSDQTFTISGLTTSDSITAVKPPSSLGNVTINGYVSASNTLLLHFCNPSAAPVTPPAGVYSFGDFR